MWNDTKAQLNEEMQLVKKRAQQRITVFSKKHIEELETQAFRGSLMSKEKANKKL